MNAVLPNLNFLQDKREIITLFSTRARDFSALSNVETGSGFHTFPYTKGIGCSFLGVKRPRLESDHASSSTAELNI
jgi:hypothetical protein